MSQAIEPKSPVTNRHEDQPVHRTQEEIKETQRFRRMVRQRNGRKFLIWLVVAAIIFYVAVAIVAGWDVSEFWTRYLSLWT